MVEISKFVSDWSWIRENEFFVIVDSDDNFQSIEGPSKVSAKKSEKFLALI